MACAAGAHAAFVHRVPACAADVPATNFVSTVNAATLFCVHQLANAKPIALKTCQFELSGAAAHNLVLTLNAVAQLVVQLPLIKSV